MAQAMCVHTQAAGGRLVDFDAPVTEETALAMMPLGDRVHTMVFLGFSAGASMSRRQLADLLRENEGAYLALPDSLPQALEHALAIWQPLQGDPRGQWLFVETPAR